jgi:hypothetical protein
MFVKIGLEIINLNHVERIIIDEDEDNLAIRFVSGDSMVLHNTKLRSEIMQAFTPRNDSPAPIETVSIEALAEAGQRRPT